MNARTQITMDPDMQRRALAKAAELGVSFAEHIRRLVANDLGTPKPKFDASVLFDLVKDGPETDVVRDKDKVLGKTFRREHPRASP
jgi:hypothetical protein